MTVDELMASIKAECTPEEWRELEEARLQAKEDIKSGKLKFDIKRIYLKT